MFLEGKQIKKINYYIYIYIFFFSSGCSWEHPGTNVASPLEVSNELRIEKMLVIQRDEEIQSAMLKLNSECEKAVAEFLSSKDLLNYHF